MAKMSKAAKATGGSSLRMTKKGMVRDTKRKPTKLKNTRGR